MDFHST